MLPPNNATNPNLQTLVQQAQQGCERAFTELVRTLSPALHRFLQSWGHGWSDTDDLVQETWLRAWRGIGRYNSRYAFTTWLYTIGRRVATSHYRRQHRLVPLDSEPTAAAAVADDTDLWQQAAALLPPRQYQALWLRYADDLSAKDVAKVLGITALHCRVLLHRARERLAIIWEKELL